MKKEELKQMSNEELFKLLREAEWLDRDLLREYDERTHDGRIPSRGETIPQNKIQEYLHNKYAERRKKKAS